MTRLHYSEVFGFDPIGHYLDMTRSGLFDHETPTCGYSDLYLRAEIVLISDVHYLGGFQSQRGLWEMVVTPG